MRLGLTTVLFFSALGLFAQTGEDLAGVYLSQALMQNQSGFPDKALGLVETALEFSPDQADALGLKGLLLAVTPPYNQAVPFLERALSQGTFKQLKKNLISEALAGVLLRLRNYDRIIQLLGNRDPKSQEEWKFFHLAYDLSGRSAEALSVLRQGQAQHPFWTGWLELLMRYPQAEPQLLSRLKKHRKETGGFPPEILDKILRRLPEDPQRTRTLVADLLSLGYTSAALELKAGELGLTLPAGYPSAAMADMARDYVQTASLAAASEGPLRDKILSLAATYTGRAFWDGDRDNWPEMILDFQSGQVEKWSLDRDQNGEPEMEVFFQNRTVSRVREVQGQTSYEAQFEEYPYLQSLRLDRPEGRTLFHFPDFQVTWKLWEPPSGMEAITEPLFWKWNNGSRSLESLMQQAPVIDRYSPEGILWSRSHLVDGQEQYREEDSDGDGRRDRVVEYSLGIPNRLWKDMDGDGLTDQLEKSTRGGNVVWIDADGDQIYEFGITAGLWKIWDYNKDGEPDFRLLQLPGKEILKIVSYRGRTSSLPTIPNWESSPWP